MTFPMSPGPDLSSPTLPPQKFVYNSTLNKRKRPSVDNESFDDDRADLSHHTAKKARENSFSQAEGEYTPLTPISPSIQTTDPFQHVSIQSRQTAQATSPCTYYQHTLPTPSSSSPVQVTSSASVESPIPAQNLLLRDIHLNSRTYQLQRKRPAETASQEQLLWEEEDSVLARYAAMNKLLGTRNLDHR